MHRLDEVHSTTQQLQRHIESITVHQLSLYLSYLSCTFYYAAKSSQVVSGQHTGSTIMSLFITLHRCGCGCCAQPFLPQVRRGRSWKHLYQGQEPSSPASSTSFLFFYLQRILEITFTIVTLGCSLYGASIPLISKSPCHLRTSDTVCLMITSSSTGPD